MIKKLRIKFIVYSLVSVFVLLGIILSIININKELKKSGKEALYVIYPVDGVSICDSPFVYVNNRNDKKKK